MRYAPRGRPACQGRRRRQHSAPYSDVSSQVTRLTGRRNSNSSALKLPELEAADRKLWAGNCGSAGNCRPELWAGTVGRPWVNLMEPATPQAIRCYQRQKR